MDKHSKAIIMETILGTFLEIRKQSWNAKIDDAVQTGVDNIYRLADGDGFRKELDEIKARRINPTN